MTASAPDSEEAQLVLTHLREHGFDLTASAQAWLNMAIENGRERAVSAGDEERFQFAVHELASRLPKTFGPEFGIGVGGQRDADRAALTRAFKSLCPMWPFC